MPAKPHPSLAAHRPGAGRGRDCLMTVVWVLAALLVLATIGLCMWLTAPQGIGLLWLPDFKKADPHLAPIVHNQTRLKEAATVLDPVMMQHAPRSYLPHLKNPCWQDHTQPGQGQEVPVNCLPYVYLSGFSTGIGSLVDRLKAHPNVVMDSGPFSPWGTDWGMWSEYRSSFPQWLKDIHANKATIQALDKNPNTSIVIDSAKSTFNLYWAGCGKVHQAFSSTAVALWKKCHDSYAADPVKYEQCMEDSALREGRAEDYKRAKFAGISYTEDQHLPLLMRAVYGDRPPKLVVMLRNPVKRMYSNYMHGKNYYDRFGRNSTGFSRFIAEQLLAWQKCLAGQTLHGVDGAGGPPARRTAEDCYLRFETLGMPEERVFYHNDQLFRGLYAPYLKIWRRFIPSENILILKARDYFKEPLPVTNQVLRFLGLPGLPDIPTAATSAGLRRMLANSPGQATTLDMESASKVAQAGAPRSAVRDQAPMEDVAKRLLLDWYRPYNEQLAKLLDDNYYLEWNENPDAE